MILENSEQQQRDEQMSRILTANQNNGQNYLCATNHTAGASNLQKSDKRRAQAQPKKWRVGTEANNNIFVK